MDQAALKRFKERIGQSAFLNSKDINENGVSVRILEWLYEDKPIHILMHQEGWETVKAQKRGETDSSISHRFGAEEQIPGDINWSKGVYKNRPTTGYPKPALGFIGWIEDKKKIVVASFTQSTIVGPILCYFDEDNKLYLKNPSSKEIVISKGDNDKYKVELAPDAPAEISPAGQAAYEQFRFSWEEYMKGGEPFEGDNLPSYQELQEVKGNKAQTKTQTKEPQKKIAPKDDGAGLTNEQLAGWRDIKTPMGKRLGDCSLSDLQDFKKTLEDGKGTHLPLYYYIDYGVANFEQASGSEEPEPEFVVKF